MALMLLIVDAALLCYMLRERYYAMHADIAMMLPLMFFATP